MIHHSNTKCDACGERHTVGNLEECRDGLLDMRGNLLGEVATLEWQLTESNAEVLEMQERLDEALGQQM